MNAPHFSQRPALDLLGVNDAYITRLPPKKFEYFGHNKYDPGYTLDFNPDLVVLFVSYEQAIKFVEAEDGEDFEYHVTAFLRHPHFQEVYWSNPVPLPYLMKNAAIIVFVSSDSEELDAIGLWNESSLGR